MESDRKCTMDILNDNEFLKQLKQKLNNSISIWGNEDRLHVDKTAKMTNTLFNTTSGEIIIGKHVFTGHNVSIITGTHDIRKIDEKRMESYPNRGRDIVIGDGVWIASNCVILGPCIIGNNSVIAAGAIVKPNTNIPPNTIWGGIPAKQLKNINLCMGGNEMPKGVNAKGILDKIQHIEEEFLVNKNESFTNEIENRINKTNWDEIQKENKDKIPKYIKQEVKSADTMWSQTYLKELNEYKDITQKIPEGTRLKFIKKIINKIMKVTNRYQEIFNNRVVGFTSILAKKITNIDNEIEKINNKLEDFITTSDERFKGNEDWSKLLSNRIDEIDAVIYKLRNELFAEIKHSINGSEVFQTKNEIEPKILSSYQEYCNKNGDVKKVNIGCGTLTKADYINIDSRELEGVDIVADVKKLPFKENQLDEIYAAHLLEHFEDETLKNELLPYWYSLLKLNGKMRIIMPNIGEMAKQYSNGEIPFSQLKEIVFGGQEYSGNYHYTMFDEDKLKRLLEEIGFQSITVISSKRKNGLCTEMEIEAIKV